MKESKVRVVTNEDLILDPSKPAYIVETVYNGPKKSK